MAYRAGNANQMTACHHRSRGPSGSPPLPQCQEPGEGTPDPAPHRPLVPLDHHHRYRRSEGDPLGDCAKQQLVEEAFGGRANDYQVVLCRFRDDAVYHVVIWEDPDF